MKSALLRITQKSAPLTTYFIKPNPTNEKETRPMKKNTTELPEVELTIKDYGDSVLVIVHHPHHWDGKFYFDNEKDAEKWIARQAFKVTCTHS